MQSVFKNLYYLVFKFTIGFLLFITIDVQVHIFLVRFETKCSKVNSNFVLPQKPQPTNSFSRDGGRSENLGVRVVMRMA